MKKTLLGPVLFLMTAIVAVSMLLHKLRGNKV